MKDVIYWALALIPCTICVTGGIIMAFNGMSNWGWVIFAGMCMAPSFKSNDDKPSDKDE